MAPNEDGFERLRDNQTQADQALGDPHRMKSLADAMAPAEAAFRERWARQDQAKIERETSPEWQRTQAAREFLDAKLPKMLHPQSKMLRGRCRPEVLEVVDAWNWGAGSRLLCGPTKLGKTTSCGVLVRRLLSVGIRMGGDAWERAKRIEWFHATDISNARKRHPLGEGEAPEVERAERASLLVLDDLGWDVEPAPIAELLNERYERETPTIVTTNLSADQVFLRYSEAVTRRIFDAGETKGKIVEFFDKKSKPREHPGQKSLDEKWKTTPDRTALDTDDGRYGPRR